VLASYLIACQSYESQEQADLVKGFLTYVVGDEGQQASAETAGSAPLPASLQEKALGIVEKISAKS
jgi:phosphate transport system substrate-binding protein